MKRQSEGADSYSKRIHTEATPGYNYELTRRAIKSKDMALWSTISANKDVYWPNDDVLRDHLEYAIQEQSSQIAIALINTKVNLQDYSCSDGDNRSRRTYMSAILWYICNDNDKWNLIAALLNNGYDINARRPEGLLNSTLLYAISGSNPLEDSALLIANGAKFKHSYEKVVDGKARMLESVRKIFDDNDNDYDEDEVRRVGCLLSYVIMGHYNNPQQVAEANSAIGLAVGQYFDPEGGDEPEGYMLPSLDEEGCVTRSTILDQIRRNISNDYNCTEFLTYCLHDRLPNIGNSLWINTVFHSFGWNTVAEVKTAIAQNPEVAQQIADKCIARLEEQHKTQLLRI